MRSAGHVFGIRKGGLGDGSRCLFMAAGIRCLAGTRWHLLRLWCAVGVRGAVRKIRL